MAHVLGEDLRLNNDDLLQHSATIDIWDRFITGYDTSDTEEVRLRKLVLMHVALCERSGSSRPSRPRRKFIASMIQQRESALS